MGETSAISWTDATFNPWWGCHEVSPACKNCYAKTWANRMGYPKAWSGRYRVFGKDHFSEVLKWDKKAAESGKRLKVFTGSMCDILDDFLTVSDLMLKNSLRSSRDMLFELMEKTTNIDWLALTKRDENIGLFLPKSWLSDPPSNIRLGVTVENQACADLRIPNLLKHWKGRNFISAEPLLGFLNIRNYLVRRWLVLDKTTPSGKQLFMCSVCGRESPTPDKSCRTISDPLESKRCSSYRSIEWVIAGGESGTEARPMHPKWTTDLRDQCAAANVPYFFKQWGEWIPLTEIGEFYSEKPKNGMPGWCITPEFSQLLDKSYRWGCLDYSGEFYETGTTWNQRQLDPDDNYEVSMYRFGKTALEKAGISNLLDGKLYQEFPKWYPKS